MADPKKPDAALIVSMASKPEKEAPAEDEGLDVAAQDILAAVQSGDAGALKAALKAFYEMC